ncbi:hypothetical protein [Ralstonia pseudosolanacearum]
MNKLYRQKIEAFETPLQHCHAIYDQLPPAISRNKIYTKQTIHNHAYLSHIMGDLQLETTNRHAALKLVMNNNAHRVGGRC